MPPRDPTATYRLVPSGVRLHYVLDEATSDARDPQAPPVVFINGLTMDTHSWAPMIGALERQRTTLRYDCRGQGLSDAPDAPYTPGLHAEDLVGLLDGLGLDRCDLVGLSNGGLVAQLVAARLGPDRVRSVVVMDSFARVDALMRLLLTGWRQAIEAGGSALRFDVATPWVWGANFAEAHLSDILAFRERAAAADPSAVRNLIDGLLDYADACEADASVSALHAIQRYPGPVRVLVGELDVLTPPRYGQAIVAAAHPGSHARLEVLRGLGHAAPIEDPASVAAHLRRFWDETVAVTS